MPFDFNDYLTVAEELAANGDEGSKRSAISRAYYSVYHLALKRAETNVGPHPRNSGKGSHQWCWDLYLTTPHHACRQLAADGDRMKRLRVKADYKPADIPRLDDEVARILQDARQFRSEISARDARYPEPEVRFQ